MTGTSGTITLARPNVPERGERAVPLPAIVGVARASSGGPPAYVTREDARALVAACATTRDRLIVEVLWQSGGRVSEVATLRLCDLDRAEGALHLTNLKQRTKRRRTKLVYVAPDLIGALVAFGRDTRCANDGHLFRTRVSGDRPISRREVHRIVQGASDRAGVRVIGADGARLATPLDFRHGAAVHLLRTGLPLTEVQNHLGHARVDTTTIYLRLTDAERRRLADRVTW